MIPNDPMILLSYVNTQLRDHYKTLDALCDDKEIDQQELIAKLALVDYEYDPSANQFV